MPSYLDSVTIPGESGQPALEGLWVGAGSLGGVVAPPHPLMGGHFSNPVVEAIAEGLAAGGLRCLLFNWRGTGESYGDPSGDPADADRDFRAALGLASATHSVVVAAGYSFGGAAAVRVAAGSPSVSVLAVAPPPVLLPEGALAAFGGRLTIVAAQNDTIAPVAEIERLLAPVPGSAFAAVPGADHFFGGAHEKLREVATRVAHNRSMLG